MELLTTILTFLRDKNAEAYLVGGFVRDQLLARTPARDIDIAIPGAAVPLARAFANAHDAAFYLMDAEHGVARVLFDLDMPLDVDTPDDLARVVAFRARRVQ